MKLSELITHDQVIEARRQRDPAFAAHWDRTALARDTAIAVIRHRAERGMTQRQLADAWGVTLHHIERLENGDDDDWDTAV